MRFLNTSMAGSYYEDCEVLWCEKFDITKHGSDLAKVLIAIGTTLPEDHQHHNKQGVWIRYADDIEGESVYIEQWIPIDRLEGAE